jgi:hypothetical protein
MCIFGSSIAKFNHFNVAQADPRGHRQLLNYRKGKRIRNSYQVLFVVYPLGFCILPFYCNIPMTSHRHGFF